MKVFWTVVCCLVIAAIVAIERAVPNFRGALPTLWEKLVFYAAGGILVGVVWAILFRSQIEKLRLSLFALFALVFMEAIWLVAIRMVHPYWSL